MKVRVISAIAAIILLAIVMYSGKEALGVAVFLLALIGIKEFYNACENRGYKPVKIVGYLYCLPLLFLGLFNYKHSGVSLINSLQTFEAVSVCIFILILSLFCIIIFSNGRYNIIDISLTLFGIIYVVFLFSFITLTRNLDKGNLYIWLLLIGAWITDTFAYFTGVSIGKTKILPAISPKKSLEGSIGGIVGCVAVMLVYGLCINKYLGFIPVYHFMILGALCGVISQLGDWAASAIKRFVNIKDFGKIMPGHGGVLDRCDSILFVAPVVYFYIKIFIQ